jgi:hypothetical protein
MYFEKAIDLLGDLPPDKALPAVERWGQALFEIIRGYRLVYAMERVESIAEKMRKGLEWAGARECQSYARCMQIIDRHTDNIHTHNVVSCMMCLLVPVCLPVATTKVFSYVGMHGAARTQHRFKTYIMKTYVNINYFFQLTFLK